MENWQKRRGEFNHDWLKNQYLLALEAWNNLLNDEISDPEFEKSFLNNDFVQWESKGQEAERLALGFAAELSPKKLLLHNSLLARCKLDTKNWLGCLIDAVWREKYRINDITCEALESIRETNEIYKRLQIELSNFEVLASASLLSPLKKSFVEFHTSCQRLSKAIEKFPSEVKVV